MKDKQGRQLHNTTCLSCGALRIVRTEHLLRDFCMSCAKAKGKGFPKGVLIDAEFLYLTKWSWRIINSGYVYHTVKGLLHRLVMDCPADMEVDHLDDNKLNCLKTNLEIVTTQENALRRAHRKRVREGKTNISFF